MGKVVAIMMVTLMVAMSACPNKGGAEGFVFEIEAHKEQCFYEQIKVETSVGLRFQVIAGGFLDVDVKIVGPDGLVIYSGDRENEGKISFFAESSGTFSFCFSNKMSTLTPKSVLLNLHIGDDPSAAASNPATKEHLNPLENSILSLSDAVNAVVEEQEYMRIRERVHHEVSENTSSRVVWWTLFETVWLICLAVWQIYSLRRVFGKKFSA